MPWIRRYINQLLVGDTNCCVKWPGATFASGYGQIRRNGKLIRAHRYICEKAHGPAPSILHEATHSCHEKLCVNPLHLSWKLHGENMYESRGHPGFVQGGRNHFK